MLITVKRNSMIKAFERYTLEEEEKDENNFMNYLKRNNMLGDDY